MNINSAVLQDSIKREIEGKDYICSDIDKRILQELCSEINVYAGTSFKYLAELDAYHVDGMGAIIANYITSFSSDRVIEVIKKYAEDSDADIRMAASTNLFKKRSI